MSALKEKAGIWLQERDLALLMGLFESRVMTAAHVRALYFDGRGEMTKKRLQRLRAAKLIVQKSPALFQHATISLAPAGLNVLRHRGALRRYLQPSEMAMERRLEVSPLTLSHELEVMDVKAAFVSAARKSGLHVATFSTWPLLNQFVCSARDTGAALVKPDGFMRLVDRSQQPPSAHEFFIELDRSTEKIAILTTRAGQYLAHGRDSGRGPFRALFILKTAERRNNVAEALLRRSSPVLTQVWLATISEVLAEPFGPIWIRPVDYRDALAGGEFDTGRHTPSLPYRRQAMRDQAVEELVPKRPLVAPREESRDEKKRPQGSLDEVST